METNIQTILAQFAETFCIEDFIDEEVLIEVKEGKHILNLGKGEPGQELVDKMKEYINMDGTVFDLNGDSAKVKGVSDEQILAAVRKHIEEFAEYYEPEEDEPATPYNIINVTDGHGGWAEKEIQW